MDHPTVTLAFYLGLYTASTKERKSVQHLELRRVGCSVFWLQWLELKEVSWFGLPHRRPWENLCPTMDTGSLFSFVSLGPDMFPPNTGPPNIWLAPIITDERPKRHPSILPLEDSQFGLYLGYKSEEKYRPGVTPNARRNIEMKALGFS